MSNPMKKGEAVNQWLKDLLTEYAESFPQTSGILEANIDNCIYGQKGLENYTFKEMWGLYSQYSLVKKNPANFTKSETDKIHKAWSSVKRWLNTPVTHISSVQMKRFRKYIYEKEQLSVRK